MDILIESSCSSCSSERSERSEYLRAAGGSRHIQGLVIACLTLLATSLVQAETMAVSESYATHCASCHGQDRLGGMGPALLPANLSRLRKPAATSVITQGRAATQMPGFADVLSESDINELVELVYSEPSVQPEWVAADINASRIVHFPELLKPVAANLKPAYQADLLNLFLIVESGDHHVTVLDGDRFEPIHRFKSRHALHGGPKYTSNGRYVYFASRDGWVSKFDMHTLKTVAEVRAGINTRNVAVSADDRYVLVGNYLPHSLVLLDAHDLSLIDVVPVENEAGDTSRVSAVYTAEPRDSFIVALKDFKEVWEIKYGDGAESDPAYTQVSLFKTEQSAVLHGDGRHVEAREDVARDRTFAIRRIKLEDYLDDFFFDDSYEHLIGAARDGEQGQVVDLSIGKRIADIDLPGMPHLGSGITWPWKDTTVLASPNLSAGVVSIIDTATWKTIKKLDTLGPGFFMRSHENSPYAWVDVFSGPDKDAVHVIDKSTLEIVKTLRPEPGKTSGHVEFTRDGRYALLSIWEHDGAVIVYDSLTLAEVSRIPASKPVGKYNVYNKITRSSGTSH